MHGGWWRYPALVPAKLWVDSQQVTWALPSPPPRHHRHLPSLAIVSNGGRARQDMQITAHKVYIIVMISLSQTRASSRNVTSVSRTVHSGQQASSSVMQVISARTE